MSCTDPTPVRANITRVVQIAYASDLEALLARYKAVGDVERLAHLSKENTRLAAYEGQYRTLLQSFDREVAAAVAAVEEAAAARGREDARLEHQVPPPAPPCCTTASADARPKPIAPDCASPDRSVPSWHSRFDRLCRSRKPAGRSVCWRSSHGAAPWLQAHAGNLERFHTTPPEYVCMYV